MVGEDGVGNVYVMANHVDWDSDDDDDDDDDYDGIGSDTNQASNHFPTGLCVSPKMTTFEP